MLPTGMGTGANGFAGPGGAGYQGRHAVSPSSNTYLPKPLGQYAGALAPPPPPPPPLGFAQQNTPMSQAPPMGMPVYQPTPVGQYGGGVIPPPPPGMGYGMQTPQQPPLGFPPGASMGYPQQQYGMPMGMMMGGQMGMPPPPPMTGANASPMPQR